MGGIFPNETYVYIAPLNTNGSALATSDKVVGEITNWKMSGGQKDTESIPVIGGFVDKDKPREQYEMAFDLIVQNTATSTLDRWDTFKYGTTGSAANEGTDKSIFISHISGGNWKTFACNNCSAITWEPEMAADDMLRGSMTFKFSPTTALGSTNLKTSALAYSVAFFNW